MADDTDARLETLELRLMEQQATIDDLNTALLAQWKDIEDLRRLVARLEDRVADVQAAGPSGEPEPPPPHY